MDEQVVKTRDTPMAMKDIDKQGKANEQAQKKVEKDPGFWDLITFAPEIFPGSGITWEKWQQNFEYEARLFKEKREEKARKKTEAETAAAAAAALRRA